MEIGLSLKIKIKFIVYQPLFVTSQSLTVDHHSHFSPYTKRMILRASFNVIGKKSQKDRKSVV